MQLHKKTIYIREEDLGAWKACPNKGLMVHNALTVTTYAVEQASPINYTREKKVVNPFDKTKGVPNTSATTKPITYKKTQNWGA